MIHHMRSILCRFCTFVIIALILCSSAYAAEQGFSVRNGDRNVPQIAITVDDCYDRNHIQEVVELCEKYNVAVTFFPIGKALKFADSELWQRALDAGCEIGNHSWGHTNLTKLSTRDIRYQMLRTQQKLDEILGYHYPMQVMRPPQGLSNSKVSEAIASVGYLRTVRWDVSQTDPKKALKAVQNGSILLYHARARDVRCLEQLIPKLLEKGYKCVTVSTLLDLDPVVSMEGIYNYESFHASEGKRPSEYINK